MLQKRVEAKARDAIPRFPKSAFTVFFSRMEEA